MFITDIGPFKKLEAPPSWRRNSLRIPINNRLELPLTLLTLPGKESDFEVGIFYRGKLESDEDGENFQALLFQNRQTESPVSLSPGQIRSLSRILDLTGFNQYVFNQNQSGYCPDFFMRSAQVFQLNGRAVLKVDGEFRADQNPDTYFTGIYTPADKRGRKVFELYLKAADRETFSRVTPMFRQLCQSVEWSELE